MTIFAVVILGAAVAVAAVWLAVRLTAIIKADGYGLRAASGLPRDWAPPELPSTPYSKKAHY